MSERLFDRAASEAARLLADVPELASPELVAAAVSGDADRLRGPLATLALNLAAGFSSHDTALERETFLGRRLHTVGEAFFTAAAVASGTLPASLAERREIREIVERINNNENTPGAARWHEDARTFRGEVAFPR